MTSTDDGRLVVYGADWCPDCRRAKQFLTTHRIDFDWIDLERTPEAVGEVERRNGGKRIIPTIVFPDGSFVSEPSNEELAERIGMPRASMRDEYDVVVVGGGPCGLTAGIYLARENARVLVVERSAPGGQAGVTERFDNYPGFPDGVGGAELADRITRQALRYGVEILQAVAVARVADGAPMTTLELSTGATVRAAAVLIATGSTYRRTGAAGEAELIGAGIHFCATCDGPFYRGARDLVVVGGGNSGLEEGLFLTQFVEHVTVVEAAPSLSGSALLREKVERHPHMSVIVGARVVAFNATSDGALASLTLSVDGAERVLETTGAFVFIGLDPNSGLCAGVLELDERGFIRTDAGFETSRPGVFAAGDVRAGSTKQIASAVGEGAAAAIAIRGYLERLAARIA